VKSYKKGSEYILGLFWFCYIPPLFLFYAMHAPADYDFMFLRWVIFLFSCGFIYCWYEAELKFWALPIGIIALVYNPIIIFTFERSTWEKIDLVSGLYFIIQIAIASYFYRRATREENQQEYNSVLHKLDKLHHNHSFKGDKFEESIYIILGSKVTGDLRMDLIEQSRKMYP
jgi:hypothetical protein